MLRRAVVMLPANRHVPAGWAWVALVVAIGLLAAAAPSARGAATALNPPAGQAAQQPDPLRILTSTTPSPLTSSQTGSAPLLAAVPPAATGAAAPQQPLRWVYMVGNKMPASLRDHAGQIDVLAPAWFHSDADGMLYGNGSPEILQFAK